MILVEGLGIFFETQVVICSRNLRNDWPKSRMNQVRNLSAWSLIMNVKYCDDRFEKFYASQEIWRVKTVPENSHQNGVAERMIRTILEHAQSMRIYVGLPKQFWAVAINTAVYLINKEPSVPMNYGILEETWTNKNINLNHMRTFDSISYFHIELSHKSKLDSKSRRCSFIGYKIDEYDYLF